MARRRKNRSSRPKVFYKKVPPWACNFLKKEAPAKVLSCKFCDIFNSIFFTERLWPTAHYFNLSDE